MTQLINKSWLWLVISILLYFGQTFGLSVVFSLGFFYFIFQFLELQSFVDRFFEAITSQQGATFGQRYALHILLGIVFLLLSLAFSQFIAKLGFILFIIYHGIACVVTLIQLFYLRHGAFLKLTNYQWLYRLVNHLLVIIILVLRPEWFNNWLALVSLFIAITMSSYYNIRYPKWPLPLWMTFLAPFRLNQHDTNLESSYEPITALRKETPLSLYIHLEHVKGGQFGHIDIGFNGKVYAYNNFDPDSWRMQRLVGDGVLVVVNEKDYLNFRRHYHSTVWVYNIPVSPAQLNKIEDFLEEVITQTEPFHLTSPQQFNHAIGKLHRWGNVQTYKFKPSSPYHTYFLLGMNCAQFVRNFISFVELDVFTTFGLQTPGSFYHYLELQKKQHPHSLISWETLYPAFFYTK